MRTILALIRLGYYDAWTYTDDAIDMAIEIEEERANAGK
jgi:hypothetical protein